MANVSSYGSFLFFCMTVLAPFVYSFSLNDRLPNNRDLVEDKTALSDVLLSTPELIRKYGYPLEEHTVQTEDGYLLTHFRIPHGHNASAGKERPPVILQHGLFVASDMWIINGQEKSIGFILADAGYDVWLTNIRGNKHSRKHVVLSPNTAKFWDFSWHEMGYYDMPATVDHILRVTGHKKVYYIGHSMGTSMFFVMNSMRPEYNEKIRIGIALAPVAFLGNPSNPFLQAILPSVDNIKSILDKANIWELVPYQRRFARLLGNVCSEGKPTHQLCLLSYFLAFGDNTLQLNKTRFPVVVSHLFAGVSVKTLIHYAQLIKTDRFQAYDYGPADNMIRYGQTLPPEYNLKNVIAPVALQFSDTDVIVNPMGVQQLSNTLPNLVTTTRVQFSRFTHNDFLLAKDVKPLVVDQIMTLFTMY